MTSKPKRFRKFGGRIFENKFGDTYSYKKNAKDQAKYYRKRGQRARVLKYNSKYYVYVT